MLLFQKDRIRFDDDLLANSLRPIETLVRMGVRIGVATAPKSGTGTAGAAGVGTHERKS